MKIAIDIDDTLTNTFEYLMPFVAEFYEKDLEELKNGGIAYDKSYFEKKTGRNIYDVVEKERFRP